jgi:hypothetical protein
MEIIEKYCFTGMKSMEEIDFLTLHKRGRYVQRHGLQYVVNEGLVEHTNNRVYYTFFLTRVYDRESDMSDLYIAKKVDRILSKLYDIDSKLNKTPCSDCADKDRLIEDLRQRNDALVNKIRGT